MKNNSKKLSGKMINKLVTALVSLVFILSIPFSALKAETEDITAKPMNEISNIYTVPSNDNFISFWGTYNGGYWTQAIKSNLFTDSDSTVKLSIFDENVKTLSLFSLDSVQNIINSRSISFDQKYIWGGLYAAPDNNIYIALGISNSECNDNTTVIEVRKYNQELQLLGTAEIKSAFGTYRIKEPFEASKADMNLNGNSLFFRTGVQHFLGHQHALSAVVNVTDMTATAAGSGGAAHSFNQFVRRNNSDAWLTVNHSDGNPYRGIILHSGSRRIPLLTVDGSDDHVDTGITVCGFEIGRNTNLLAGSINPVLSLSDTRVTGMDDINHDDIEKAAIVRNRANIYVMLINKTTSASSIRLLTNYKGTENINISEPKLVELDNNDRFAVIWSEVATDGAYAAHSVKTEYRVINSNGDILESKSYQGIPFSSQMQPLYKDSRILWLDSPNAVGLNDPTHYLYSLDVNGTDNGNGTTPAIERSKVEGFVTRLYQTGLSRAPDQSGLDFWVNAMADGSTTGAKAAENFLNSLEIQNRGLSDSDFLDALYRALMDRQSDFGGKAYWQEFLSNGCTRTGILKQFLLSQEFQRICDSYGIYRGEPTTIEARDQNLNLTLFINRQYKEILGRIGDAEGINYWADQILNGESMEEVSRQLVFSPEFTNKNYNDTDFLKILYRAFMGREADTGGLDYWVGQMNSGVSRQDIFLWFAYSLEFKAIISSALG